MKIDKNKIAFNLSIDNIITKEDLLDYMLFSVKTIIINIENNCFYASNKEDLSKTFLSLKNKINQWSNEKSHQNPFYPRKFVKDLLKSGKVIQLIERKDKKNNPYDYGFHNKKEITDFIIKRIEKNNEENGLKFKPNEMSVDSVDNMPMDVYNAIINYNGKKIRIYLKFYIKEVIAYFDLEISPELNVISFHDDLNQKNIDKK